MAHEKKSFTAYCDWLAIFEELTDEEAGKLVKHLFRYVNDLEPNLTDRITKLTFTPIKQTLKRDLKKWENKKIERKNWSIMGNLKKYKKDLYDQVKQGKLTIRLVSESHRIASVARSRTNE